MGSRLLALLGGFLSGCVLTVNSVLSVVVVYVGWVLFGPEAGILAVIAYLVGAGKALMSTSRW